MRVLVLWSPILKNDNRFAAEKATTYLSDPRVLHFWDLWTFGMNHYTKTLGYPSGELAWDIFLLYKPGAEWILPGPDPGPDYWAQHRGLEVGPNYDQATLKTELEKLLHQE